MPTLKSLKRSLNTEQCALYDQALNRLIECGTTTDHALLKENFEIQCRRTGIPRQILRALRQHVINWSATLEVEQTQNKKLFFSSGFHTVDQMLPGGFYLGQVMEIQAPVRPLCLAFVSETMKAFLEGFAKSKIHYIDTIGSFEPEILKRIASQVQKPDESIEDVLNSIRCFQAFSIEDLVKLLQQIGANHVTDDVPTLVVLDNLKDILDREWSIDTRKIIDLARNLQALRRLDITVAFIRTVEGHTSVRKAPMEGMQTGMTYWDSCVDTRLFLSRISDPRVRNDRRQIQCILKKCRTRSISNGCILTD